MTEAINLAKRVEHVGISLAKKGISVCPKVRVGLALDVSGSAHGLYMNGVMEETVNRLLAVAIKFDDNGELDMWSFDTRSDALPPATAQSYNAYVMPNIVNNSSISKWGGTNYQPCAQKIVEHYFGASPVARAVSEAKGFLGKLFSKPAAPASPQPQAAPATKEPAMVLFVTDGANSDPVEMMRLLTEAASQPIYWQMVGVGPAHYFKFIQEAADKLPNVGFVNLSTLSMTDEQLYSELISDEFCTWIKQW